jgi:hypothetical protein
MCPLQRDVISRKKLTKQSVITVFYTFIVFFVKIVPYNQPCVLPNSFLLRVKSNLPVVACYQTMGGL